LRKASSSSSSLQYVRRCCTSITSSIIWPFRLNQHALPKIGRIAKIRESVSCFGPAPRRETGCLTFFISNARAVATPGQEQSCSTSALTVRVPFSSGINSTNSAVSLPRKFWWVACQACGATQK
jgi:hypothetical protein